MDEFQTPFIDCFQQDLPPGKVIGSNVDGYPGTQRKGIDLENVIAIDHGALRIQPLIRPGWGRSSLSYGPYRRANGLAFAVSVLNGHNTSENCHPIETLPRRIKRWMQGSETDPIPVRMFYAAKNGSPRRLGRLFRRWWTMSRPGTFEKTEENLSIGWFDSETIQEAPASGNVFTLHAAGPENGELWAAVAGNWLSALKGLQDIPVCYVIVLRETGAAYYAASMPNAYGLPGYPHLRPLGIDPFQQDPVLYASIHQSVLGQIGFHVDSRVYSAQVAQLAEFTQWYGSAHAADSLIQNRPIDSDRFHEAEAETGGNWQVLEGAFARHFKGAVPREAKNRMILTPAQPSGLIHMRLHPGANWQGWAGLVWRWVDAQHFWEVRLDGHTAHLEICLAGQRHAVASAPVTPLEPEKDHSLQVLDDGKEIGIYLDGQMLFDRQFKDHRLQEGNAAGLLAQGTGSLTFRDFEAHPRTILAPASLQMVMPQLPQPGEIVLTDRFNGPPSDLAESKRIEHKSTPHPLLPWKKQLGRGVIERAGSSGARVRASVAEPNPGRTLYLLDWQDTGFADLAIDVLPPGTQRGQWEKGRAGLVFWQDRKNYITVSTWLDDAYQGASISSFFFLNGYEELYDAVWTNVGQRVTWGQPYRLCVWFDGLQYLASVNDEPVLYRSLTDVYPGLKRLKINQVGITANWEWGNDTGSVFQSFEARKGAWR